MQKTTTLIQQHQHHGHIHEQYHKHNHLPENQRTLAICFLLIASFMVVEFIGGFITKSLALISDAGHMLSDAVSLGVALIAVLLAKKSRSVDKSFGYLRFEILAALFNGVALIAIAIYIFIEAFARLDSPAQIQANGMLIISSIGLIINIIVALIIFKSSDTQHDVNMKGAFLHVIADLLGSIGAIIAGLCIYFFAWSWADSVASVIVASLVAYSGVNVMKEAVHILLQGTPTHLDLTPLYQFIQQDARLVDLQDIHLWTLNSQNYVFTGHLIVRADVSLYECQRILHDIEHVCHDIGIEHTTIQIETAEKSFRY
ncbi:MAG: cation diffusion facilitator family transporter [Acinetobacter sp.]|nr:cation diffusion facilitator family transporter [Acinetobacter sp.]